MKKWVLFIILLILPGGYISAKYAELFSYDKTHVKTAFLQADVLDHWISTGEYNIRKGMENPVLANFHAENFSSLFTSTEEVGKKYFWIGFFLGCVVVVGWIAVIIITLSRNDKEKKKKILWGCAIGGLISTALSVLSLYLIAESLSGITIPISF